MMFLWWVEFDDDEWGCFVVAETRGKAKSAFWQYWNSTCTAEFTDIRCTKRKAADGHKSGAIYDMDCPELAALGERYLTEEEMAAREW